MTNGFDDDEDDDDDEEETTMRSEGEIVRTKRRLRLMQDRLSGSAAHGHPEQPLAVAILVLDWVLGDDTALSEIERQALTSS